MYQVLHYKQKVETVHKRYMQKFQLSKIIVSW